MSWFRKIFKDSHEGEVCRLLNLRSTRFRQLLRNYGKILDRLADAAEKQAGEYILDRQYSVSLAEIVMDQAESIVFDLNVITDNRHYAFYDVLGKINAEIRSVINTESLSEISTDYDKSSKPPAELSSSSLAQAISRSKVLFRNEGQVACRGVAAGVVFNIETAEKASEFPEGAVMVAASIRPDDELIRVMSKATAILTDFGEPAGDTAILAREFQIPMIVGVKGASKRLETGSTITVDADENTIYLGRLQELLDYYQAERPTLDEEPEYKMLRRLRQSMFRLTLTESDNRELTLQDCKSIHDLVHFASELAGDALVEMASNRRDLKSAYTEVMTGFPGSLRVIDVGDGLLQSVSDTDRLDLEKVRSMPLLTFIDGLQEMQRYAVHSSPPASLTAAIFSTIKEEHANIIMLQSGTFDIVDSLIGESKDSNHIYCRFATRIHEEEAASDRGAMTRKILTRLNFAVAQTPRASSAWISGLPLIEMKDRLAIIGRLSAYLWLLDTMGGEKKGLDETVEDFMEQYA